MAVAEGTISHLHAEMPTDLYEAVQRQAEKEGRSVAEVTRRALRVRLGQPEEGLVEGAAA